MDIRLIDLPAIAVIGKAGLCTAQNNIAQALWADATARFAEVAPLGMKEPDGSYTGFWGAMSDESMSFLPWTENFTRGYYLAGIEVYPETAAPEGWTKWVLPARRYLVRDVPEGQYGAVFAETLREILPERGLSLCGAVCDYTKPATGRNMLFFPVSPIA